MSVAKQTSSAHNGRYPYCSPYCSWCGHEFEPGERVFANRRGEAFCSKNHRTASNAALARLHARMDAKQAASSSDSHKGEGK